MDIDEAQAIVARADYHIDINGDMEPELIDAIDTVFQALERTRWIPVSERVPSEDDGNEWNDVMAYRPDRNWTEIVGYGAFNAFPDMYSHWMPLPNPPEVE